jgi:dTDP-4-dehydrorhamnose 3,5-epimerase-like enzyme
MNEAAELLPGAFYLPASAAGGDPLAQAAAGLARLGMALSPAVRQERTFAANEIHGMHCQRPSQPAELLVGVSQGCALVVLLDLRRGLGFGRARGVTIDSHDPAFVRVPPGVAWGHKALEDGTVVVVGRAADGEPDEAAGIRFDSFGFDWRCSAPIVSDSDLALPALRDFDTPF